MLGAFENYAYVLPKFLQKYAISLPELKFQFTSTLHKLTKKKTYTKYIVFIHKV